MSNIVRAIPLIIMILIVLFMYTACSRTASSSNIEEAIYTSLNMKNEYSKKGRRNMLEQKISILRSLHLAESTDEEAVILKVFDHNCEKLANGDDRCNFKVTRSAPGQAEKTLQFYGVKITYSEGYKLLFLSWLGRGSIIKNPE